MKLEIVSGQPEVDLIDKFTDILVQNDINSRDTKHCLMWPERKIHHPKTLYDTIKQTVKEHIEANSDLFILTYSDHVLNATRVEIKNHKFDGAKCHQFTNAGVDGCAKILSDGRLEMWVDNVFDVWDKALYELV